MKKQHHRKKQKAGDTLGKVPLAFTFETTDGSETVALVLKPTRISRSKPRRAKRNS